MGPDGQTHAEPPETVISAQRNTGSVAKRFPGEQHPLQNRPLSHTHLVPQASPLVVDEVVSQVPDDQLTTLRTNK